MRIVVFDLDGTLIDSEAGIVFAMQRTVEALKLPQETVEHWRRLIGVPLREQMPLILPEGRREQAAEVIEVYRQVYREVMLATSLPFEGVPELLQALHARGVVLAICSGKRGRAIAEVLAHLGWQGLFKAVVSPDDVIRGKPDPESLLRVLEVTGCLAAEAIMVGDTTFDLEMARGAGVAGCAVTWGTHGRPELARSRPDYWADSVAVLGVFLMSQLNVVLGPVGVYLPASP
ncbi:MAG: HAD family hydrolase, partial [Gemmatimonadaceae bacterium]|nr:HAD family hydrolase [Gloeobacterales cyanobacterium ES-bin-141]